MSKILQTLQIIVGNLRTAPKEAPGASVICDRTSVLGNPFKMTDRANDSDRSAVIEGFRGYLHLVANQGEKPGWAANEVVIMKGLTLAPSWITPTTNEFMAELERVELLARAEPVTLLCWCAPKACHGDILIRYLLWKDASRQLALTLTTDDIWEKFRWQNS
jgi:hypothetical protein